MSLRSAASIVVCLALAAWFWNRGERFIAANGPTFDEGAHLAAGYSYWSTGEFRLNPEHPPLLKLLWAAPLAATGSPPFPREAASATSNHWHIANALLYESGVPPRQLLEPARRVNLCWDAGSCLLVGLGGVSRVGIALRGGRRGAHFAAATRRFWLFRACSPPIWD